MSAAVKYPDTCRVQKYDKDQANGAVWLTGHGTFSNGTLLQWFTKFSTS